MNIQLIQGQFNAKDAISIFSQMIHVKIRYHEDKIDSSSNEEDIKFRETKIKRLQKDLSEARTYVDSQAGKVIVQSDIHLSIEQ